MVYDCPTPSSPGPGIHISLPTGATWRYSLSLMFWSTDRARVLRRLQELDECAAGYPPALRHLWVWQVEVWHHRLLCIIYLPRKPLLFPFLNQMFPFVLGKWDGFRHLTFSLDLEVYSMHQGDVELLTKEMEQLKLQLAELLLQKHHSTLIQRRSMLVMVPLRQQNWRHG